MGKGGTSAPWKCCKVLFVLQMLYKVSVNIRIILRKFCQLLHPRPSPWLSAPGSSWKLLSFRHHHCPPLEKILQAFMFGGQAIFSPFFSSFLAFRFPLPPPLFPFSTLSPFAAKRPLDPTRVWNANRHRQQMLFVPSESRERVCGLYKILKKN